MRRSATQRVRTCVRLKHPCGQSVPASHGTTSFSSCCKEKTAAITSALRHQIEFCCLVTGWDTPCTTCPIDWRGFDPNRRYRMLRASANARSEIDQAMDLMGIDPLDITREGSSSERRKLSVVMIKAAFRRKALEWHPDCNSAPDAADRFREILDAYELLLASLRSR